MGENWKKYFGKIYLTWLTADRQFRRLYNTNSFMLIKRTIVSKTNNFLI
jgi:hypothetical protein